MLSIDNVSHDDDWHAALRKIHTQVLQIHGEPVAILRDGRFVSSQGICFGQAIPRTLFGIDQSRARSFR